MADIVTKQELENASIDAKDLGECVHGNETGIVTPRLGDPYPTLPAAIAKIENKGGYIAVANLTELNAVIPEFNHQVARTDDTGDEYRWNPAATPTPKWEPTGKNYLHDAKEYVDTSLPAEQTENLYSEAGNHNNFNINPSNMAIRTGVNTSVNITELEFGKTYQLKTDAPIDKALVIVGTHLTGTIDTTKVLNRITLADTADPLIKTFTMPTVHKYVFINVWWSSASLDIRDDLVLANAGVEVKKVVKKIQGNDVYDADAQQKIKDLQDTVVVDSDIETENISLYKPENERTGFYVNRSLSVISALSTSSLVVFPIESGKTYLITSPAFLTNSCVGLKVDDSIVTNAPLEVILLADHAVGVKKFTVPVGSTAKFALFTTYLSTQNYDVRGNIVIQDFDNQAVVKKIMGASVVADLPENFEQRFEDLETKVDNLDGVSSLFGKKWAVIGDSITEKNFRTNKNYHEYVSDMAGGMTIYNYGTSSNGWNDKANTPNLITENPDIITVFLGTNDFGVRARALGAFGDGTGIETVAGSINLLLTNLVNKFPTKRLGIILPLPRYNSFGINGGTPNAFGVTLRQISELIVQYANHFGISYVDLYNESGLAVYNAAANSYYFTRPGGTEPDGVHPNDLGHALIAIKIKKWLESFI